MKTSNAQDHKEYIYQVSSTYDHGNFEKNRGNPKINLSCGDEGGIFFHEFFGNNQNVGSVLIKDMQTPPLDFDQPFMDDEECVT